MADGSRQNEKMPDRVMIREASPDIKNYSNRIETGSWDDQVNYMGRHICKEFVSAGKQHPPHNQVDKCWKDFKLTSKKCFEDGTEKSERPQNDEERNAKAVIYKDEKERRICSCDKPVNADMVELFEDGTQSAFRLRMK